MVRSVRTHVHVTGGITVDVSGTMEFVETLKSRREFTGLRISPLLIYAKAVCLALGRNPDLNTSWDEERQEIVYYGDVNLGIAAATPRGLMVPNIKGAQRLSLLQLARPSTNWCRCPARASSSRATTQRHVHHHQRRVFGTTRHPIINGDESAISAWIDRAPAVGRRDGRRGADRARW